MRLAKGRNGSKRGDEHRNTRSDCRLVLEGGNAGGPLPDGSGLGPPQSGTGEERVACDDGAKDPLGFGVSGREVQHLLGIGDGIITRGESEPILRQGALRLDENGFDPGGWTRPLLLGTRGEPG